MFPWLPEPERRTIAQWQDWVALLNQVAQASQARGLQLAYHNHDFELTAIDGVRPIDVLLDGIDRDVVKWELDLYWLAKAGGDGAFHRGARRTCRSAPERPEQHHLLASAHVLNALPLRLRAEQNGARSAAALHSFSTALPGRASAMRRGSSCRANLTRS